VSQDVVGEGEEKKNIDGLIFTFKTAEGGDNKNKRGRAQKREGFWKGCSPEMGEGEGNTRAGIQLHQGAVRQR